jgi:hypothetical protein
MMNWQVGDLAVCVAGPGPWAVLGDPSDPDSAGPASGEVHRVDDIRFAPIDGELELHFDPWPRDFFPAAAHCG